jgi:hypothetical protein
MNIEKDKTNNLQVNKSERRGQLQKISERYPFSVDHTNGIRARLLSNGRPHSKKRITESFDHDF